MCGHELTVLLLQLGVARLCGSGLLCGRGEAVTPSTAGPPHSPTRTRPPPHWPQPKPRPRTLSLLTQALVPLALLLGGPQLGQLVAELLTVHKRLLLLLPLLLQLGLQRVHLALQLGDVPLGL